MALSNRLKVTPLAANIGGLVEGVDLSQNLSDETIADIRGALLDRQVLFFENQDITPRQHIDFAARFGALHTHPLYPAIEGIPEMIVLDNHKDNPTDNDSWHTDVTFIETPPLGSILKAELLPPFGGDTVWSSMTAAYKGLSPTMQKFLSGLYAVHDFTRSFPEESKVSQNAGDTTYAEARRKHPPLLHPVIRTHPETGEPCLFVNNGYTTRIKGMRGLESKAIIDFLFQHIQKPEFCVRWRWSPNAIAFWDNRCTQHYAVNDYLPHRRVMHRATILGDKPYFRAAA
jgi:taurine dioxygenase